MISTKPSPLVSTDTHCFVPHEVSPERRRKFVACLFSGWPGRAGSPAESATSELQPRTCGQNIPPWWSVESKSFVATLPGTPCSQVYSTAWRMKLE